ncbi:HNH endonuclease signature motif containing protein [Qaidamihabitans albus]|uniref:HNH endonuclease signature motif containing protein n=1 Tax=Qaidamihabitans albus TaxID=2795733 RepID=UPI0018F1BC24|nr:HNH endonuclease signature motif containing protein [Qaidamihabitans albus]
MLRALRETEVARRQAYARELRLLAEIESRGVATTRGYGSASALLCDMFSTGLGQARRMIGHARALNPSLTPSGAAVEPALPAVAEALEEGAIGPEHVEAIRTAMGELPAGTAEEDRVLAEKILSEAAAASEPRILARLGREIRDRLDPDGNMPKDSDLERPLRRLEMRERRDGGVSGSFELDAEAGALLSGLLSPLTAPRGTDGPDPRGREARYGDAFVEVLTLAARCPETPGEAGEPVTLLVSARLDELRAGLGHGLVDGYLNLPAAQIRRMTCDCRAVPMVFGARGETLDIGRASRTVPRPIRRALISCDAGCTFPGCDRRPKWCQAHHVIHWVDGGPTALGNLALICERHHRMLHHTEWSVRMIDGRPWYTPPAYVDPQRLPRRNTVHAARRESRRPRGQHGRTSLEVMRTILDD